jgi:hypothetical protein
MRHITDSIRRRTGGASRSTKHFAAIPCAARPRARRSSDRLRRRCTSPISRTSPTSSVPTKSFATLGGIIEINLLALTNTATREKQVIEADIPGMAALAVHQGKRVPASFGTDGNWAKRPGGRQGVVGRIPGPGACRSRSSHDDLRTVPRCCAGLLAPRWRIRCARNILSPT